MDPGPSSAASELRHKARSQTDRVTEDDVGTLAEQKVAADLVVPPIICDGRDAHGLGTHHLLQN